MVTMIIIALLYNAICLVLCIPKVRMLERAEVYNKAKKNKEVVDSDEQARIVTFGCAVVIMFILETVIMIKSYWVDLYVFAFIASSFVLFIPIDRTIRTIKNVKAKFVVLVIRHATFDALFIAVYIYMLYLMR